MRSPLTRPFRARATGIALAVVAVCVVIGGGCGGRDYWPGPVVPPGAHSAGAALATSAEAPQSFSRAAGPHPRVLLTPERLAVLAALRDAGAREWLTLVAQCDGAVRETIGAGYEAWDWANATLALAICHKVTNRPEYATAALKYFRALLDDKTKVGDKLGGDSVVEHDDGYAIRTHGGLGAIALDWLYDAPGMTGELRKHALDRLVTWTSWFKQKGFGHEQPISNYYVGYFAAVAFGGIATEAAPGDQAADARAIDLRRQTQEMWQKEIVPSYKSKLAGGDFPEGWQYGSLVAELLAIYTDAENTAHPVPRGAPPPRPLYDELPWLKDTVTYHAHALLPDGKHVHEAGDWQEKPPLATSHELMAIAMVLPPTDAWGRQARFLMRLSRDAEHEEQKWLAVLSDDPSRPVDDPRKGATSYLARGTGQLLARTDWTSSAIFTALACGPTLADHQHLDAGHFAIVRGADHLVIDSGAYGSFSSTSHNTILVDADKDMSTYTPNQGTWSNAASIARYEDTGGFVYAMADYASAYNPSGYPSEQPQRAVQRAEREMIFSRAPVAAMPGGTSARVVVYDRMTVLKAEYKTTFVLHPPANTQPDVWGTLARFQVGHSAAWVTTLLPQGAAAKVVHEPTPNPEERPFYENKPPEGMKTVRLEIASPAGASQERRFLHAFVVGAAGEHASAANARDRERDKAPTVMRLEGELVDGAIIENEVYVFTMAGPAPTPFPFAYRTPPAATKHIVVGLAPNGRYGVTVSRVGATCRVAFTANGDRTASSQGMMVLDVRECAVKR